MDIDITDFYQNACPKDYSASVAEIGENAAAYTWRAAIDDALDYLMLDTDDKRDAFKAYIIGFGAWTHEEIEAWTNIELNALFIQFVAGSMRDTDTDCHNIFENDDRFYYYIGE